LANGSSFADARNEHSNKGGPSHPPGHVENGPGILEPNRSGLSIDGTSFTFGKLSKCIRVEAELEDTPLQVETDTLHDQIEDVIGPFKSKAQKQEHHPK
jgi:hypothetical protein